MSGWVGSNPRLSATAGPLPPPRPQGHRAAAPSPFLAHLQHPQIVPHQRLPAEGQVGSPPLLQVGVLLRQRAQRSLGIVQGLFVSVEGRGGSV